MAEFEAVVLAAKGLSDMDRQRLIDALWDTVPPDADASCSDAWAREIERRVVELDAGTADAIPWSEIRDEALARIGDGQGS